MACSFGALSITQPWSQARFPFPRTFPCHFFPIANSCVLSKYKLLLIMPRKKHNQRNKVLLLSHYPPLFIILSIRKLSMHYFGLPTLFSYYSTYIQILLLHPDTYSTYIQIIQKLLALKHIFTLKNTTIKIYCVVILQIQICTHEFKYACIDIRLTFYKSWKKE